jgi:hypothetical protein
MKGYGSGGMTPLILNISTKRGVIGSLHIQTTFPLVKVTSVPFELEVFHPEVFVK